MELNLKDISSASAQGLFNVGDTVSIVLYKSDQTLEPLDSAVCDPFPSPNNDMFQWNYSDITDLPTDYEEYAWVMTNQVGIKQRDVDSFSTGGETFFSVPFDVDVSKLAINKGDTFEPEIRVDTNSLDLNVAVLFTDGETSDSTNIYKATSDVVDRGDGLPGGDDQVKLVAQGDTFQIFRIFLSGDETSTFSGRFVDMEITAETNDGKIQTIKKKIGFSQTPAIGFDTVP